MRPIERSEVLGLGDYEQIRDRFRRRLIELKKRRRVGIGDRVTVMFENRDTALLQIQEMLRTERITSESAVMHEINTYNELVPGNNQLSMTLFIEEPDKPAREKLLTDLAGMESQVVLIVDDERCPATPGEKAGAEAGRTTAVQYYLIDLSETAAQCLRERRAERVAVAIEHPAYPHAAQLSDATLAELAADLNEP